MSALTAALHLFAAVFVVSGAQKLIDPEPAADAMENAGLPHPGSAALRGRLLGAVEWTIGLLALAMPERWAAAVLAISYLLLALFVLRLRRVDSTAGCGCFGAASTPPGTAHVVLNVSAAATGAAAAVVGVTDITAIMGGAVLEAASYLVLLATGSGLLLLGPALWSSLSDPAAGDQTPTFHLTSQGGQP